MPTQSCDGTVIAEGANGAAAFTLVSPYLYWKEAARLMRIRLDPLGTPEVIYDGSSSAVSMAADASYAYFTTVEGTLQRIALGGEAAAPDVLLDLGIGLLDVEVDATSAYVTASSNGLFMLPKGGGAPVSLVSGNAAIVELAGDHAYVTVTTFTQGTETFDGVVRVPRAGGEVESFYQGGPVVAMEPVANGMLLMKDATVVYQPFGGSPTEVFTCALECGAIVPDGDVFFVSHNDGPFSEPSSNGVIDAVPFSGGAATRVGEHRGPLFSIKSHLDRIVVSSYQTSGQLLSFGKCPCE